MSREKHRKLNPHIDNIDVNPGFDLNKRYIEIEQRAARKIARGGFIVEFDEVGYIKSIVRDDRTMEEIEEAERKEREKNEHSDENGE